jgi:hypothetical protein
MAAGIQQPSPATGHGLLQGAPHVLTLSVLGADRIIDRRGERRHIPMAVKGGSPKVVGRNDTGYWIRPGRDGTSFG